MELTSDESRVFGVLIEKALSTPGQYPLTVNAITAGCNQKSNRDPVMAFDDIRVQRTLDSLRGKGLVVEVNMTGSRVLKYRHQAKDKLDIGVLEQAVLAELLLRGPQTLGELRTRASRMRPIESLDVAANVVQMLAENEPPLAQRIAPAPGSRAERYVQLLCEGLHPLDAPAGGGEGAAGHTSGGGGGGDPVLRSRVESLEAEVATLRAYLTRLAESLGEAPPPGAGSQQPRNSDVSQVAQPE